METRIVWFRRDLRLADHPALVAALPVRGDVRLVCLFVLDPAIVERGRMSPARLRYLADALGDLDGRLRDRGGRLVVRGGRPAEVLPAVAAEAGASAVHICADASPYAMRRDAAVARALAAAGTALERHGGIYVTEPGSVTAASGEPYKVFSPFSRTWRAMNHGAVLPTPAEVPTAAAVTSDGLPSADDLLAAAGLVDGDLDVAALPAGGETAARRRLDGFLSERVDDYDAQREVLSADGTSRLSADLHYGCLSAREVDARLDRRSPGQKAFGAEIAWRDFYGHVLARWPHVLTQAFTESAQGLPWATSGAGLDAWREARTGYPVVDAAMTQLHRTGWMHNRARMIVASFLTKDLRVHWRCGEDHFLRHLVDGDLASNNGGWQWAAGTGTDAQPFFRIFNPVTQGQRHDPDGTYVRRWLPVLTSVPDRYVHHPWDMPDQIRAECGVVIGRDYPAPLVDHAEERTRTLEWFAKHRG